MAPVTNLLSAFGVDVPGVRDRKVSGAVGTPGAGLEGKHLGRWIQDLNRVAMAGVDINMGKIHVESSAAGAARANRRGRAGDVLDLAADDMRSMDQILAGEDFLPGLKAIGAGIAGTVSKAQNFWEVTVNNETNTKINDGKGPGKTRSYGARGRGDAAINSTAELRFLLFEDRLIPMADEFSFGHLLAEGPAA